MTHLVIGLGEVGSAVYEVLSEQYRVETLDVNDEAVQGDIGALHVCFPYSEQFIEQVLAYAERFDPLVIIVYSSLPVGTTKRLGYKAVHSPVEGKHPKLRRSMKLFKRFIGHNHAATATRAERIWKPLAEVELVANSDCTEFLKLASTSKYGLNLVWADYMAAAAKQLDMDYKLVKQWDRAYNGLYKGLHLNDYRKYVLDPPEGRIGGHCVVPNAELLDEQFPHSMLKMIKEMQ